MNITQRNAKKDDLELLFNWRNHSHVRNFSTHDQSIPLEEHTNWFLARIERLPQEPFNLFEYQNMAVGMCRLDKSSITDDLFEISIIVAPDFQKKGFGRLMLEKSCESFFEIYPDYRILARVHVENTNSRRLFESENFKLANRNEGFDYYFKIKDNLVMFEKQN